MTSTTIDLTKPIEAVHKDGRVVPMEFDCSQEDGRFYTTIAAETARLLGASWFYWEQDGTPVAVANPWTIRNVAEPEQPADPDDWAIEAALKITGYTGGSAAIVRATVVREQIWAKAILALARMIQRYQPELEPKPPVDPDVEAVREILGAWCVAAGLPTSAAKYRDGTHDERSYFLAAVEAFKRVKGGVL